MSHAPMPCQQALARHGASQPGPSRAAPRPWRPKRGSMDGSVPRVSLGPLPARTNFHELVRAPTISDILPAICSLQVRLGYQERWRATAIESGPTMHNEQLLWLVDRARPKSCLDPADHRTHARRRVRSARQRRTECSRDRHLANRLFPPPGKNVSRGSVCSVKIVDTPDVQRQQPCKGADIAAAAAERKVADLRRSIITRLLNDRFLKLRNGPCRDRAID